MAHALKVGIAMVVVSAGASMASAQLSGSYYKLPNSVGGHTRHTDVQVGVDGARVAGLVENALGPNGLPIATNFALTRAAGSGAIEDVNANNEILWWTPGRAGNREVIFEKNQLDGANLNITANFFPDGQTNNNTYFRAVHWQGTFELGAGESGSVIMSIQADDDAWVFINGQLALDDGGVKALNTAAPVFNAASLVAGSNTIDIFFADRHQSQSAIVFTSNLQIIPAPGAAALLGLGGLTLQRRRRR